MEELTHFEEGSWEVENVADEQLKLPTLKFQIGGEEFERKSQMTKIILIWS